MLRDAFIRFHVLPVFDHLQYERLFKGRHMNGNSWCMTGLKEQTQINNTCACEIHDKPVMASCRKRIGLLSEWTECITCWLYHTSYNCFCGHRVVYDFQHEGCKLTAVASFLSMCLFFIWLLQQPDLIESEEVRHWYPWTTNAHIQAYQTITSTVWFVAWTLIVDQHWLTLAKLLLSVSAHALWK